MKHRIFGKQLGRNHNERQALFRSLTRSMFTHGSIQTTETKAKSVVSTIERLSNIIITKPDITARRELFKFLQDRNWVNNVMTTFKSIFGDQKCNFTKITRIKRRQGDDAIVVQFSFVKPIKFSPKKEKIKEIKKETVKPKKTVKKTVVKKKEPKK